MATADNRRGVLRALTRKARGGLVDVKTAALAWRISNRAAATRMARLARSGWANRVRRGMYYLPSLAEGPSIVAEDAWVLADVLFSPCYIAGWTAAQHWGLTEQLFRETFVATASNIRARRQTVLGTEFRLARVARPRVESVDPVWRGSTKVRTSSPERTLVDGLVNPRWVGGIRHLAEMLPAYRESPGATEEKLALALRAFGNGAAHKRAGYLLDRLWPEARRLHDLAVEKRTTGVIRLDPAVRSRGRMNRRWGLWVNVAVPASGAAP